MIKKIFLFLIPFLIAAIAVPGYFIVTKKVANFNLPVLPSLPFSDLVKFSRFSLEKAPSQSLVGSMSLLNGEVFYESRLATEAAVIKSPAEIQQGDKLSTGDNGKIIVNYTDAAEITIYNDSEVLAVQTLPKDMVFAQNKGVVEYNKTGIIPLTIRSKHLLIEDNGDVIVTVDKNEPLITVQVKSGTAVLAYNDATNNSRLTTSAEGEILIFNDETRQLVPR